jgi:N-acetylneuraminic acid mutarotase
MTATAKSPGRSIVVALAVLLAATGCRSGGKRDAAKDPGTTVTQPGGATGDASGGGASGAGGGAAPGDGDTTNPSGGSGGATRGSGGSGAAPNGGGPIVGLPTDPGAGPARPEGWRKLAAGPLRGRHGAGVVWTGREMVVWGGAWRAGNASIWLDDGAAYDPVGDRWRSIANSPLGPREEALAVWTGREVLVWGGRPGTEAKYGYNDFVDGALYDPARNTWRPMAEFPLGPRWGARAVWSGTVLVVWGGARADEPEDAPRLADGAAYDPARNEWKKLPDSPLTPRLTPLGAAWNGSVLLSWGYGQENAPQPGSALYDPAGSKWRPAAPAPAGELDRCSDAPGCVGIQAGNSVLFSSDGLAWDPSADRWKKIAASPFVAPQLDGEARAWTGSRFMVFGGGVYEGGDGPEPPPARIRTDGAAYDPAADRWETLPPAPLAGRARARAVWTGREFIVWGGEADYDHRAEFADGAALTP